jgi:hypothetical protein
MTVPTPRFSRAGAHNPDRVCIGDPSACRHGIARSGAAIAAPTAGMPSPIAPPGSRQPVAGPGAPAPTMLATVIAKRIGWRYSMTTVKDRVRQIRPEYLGVDPVDRVSYQLWVSGYRVGCGSHSRDIKRVGLLF